VAELADVVASLRRAGPRCRSLKAGGREWRHHALLNEAFMSAAPLATPGSGGRLMRTSGEPWPEESEETWGWWSDGPDRLKVEFAVGDEMVMAWFQGTTWWSWSLSQGARTNEGRKNAGHGKGPGEVLVSPARAARVLSFELLGALTFLARPAFLLRARPFSRGDFDLHALGRGADEYKLVVDAERGFLLRAEASLGATPFRVLEMTEVNIDGDIPRNLFTPTAPEGHMFEYFEPWSRLALQELPNAVPFHVFVPATGRERVVSVEVRNPGLRSAAPVSVRIVYSVARPGGGRWGLWMHQSAERERLPLLPTEIGREVDGFLVWANESREQMRCKVLFERNGTHIHLAANAAALHELIHLARSVVPLTTGTPPGV